MNGEPDLFERLNSGLIPFDIRVPAVSGTLPVFSNLVAAAACRHSHLMHDRPFTQVEEIRGNAQSPSSRFLIALAAGILAAMPLHAADVEGTVVVQRRLTKAKVTATANTYSRGMAVELHADSSPNVLSFERSHIAIYLEGSLPSRPATGTMDQKDREFSPDMLVLPAGSAVSFPNLDPIFHNVFSLSKPKEFDLGNYPKDHTRIVTFNKPGIVFVNCHLHSNMSAVIVITPNQWSARADASGRFRLSEVPPGTYTIVAWHKSAGFFRQRVTVTEDGSVPVTFFIPLPAEQTVASR